MEARLQILKQAALSGVLDALPLDALKLYLLLIASAEDVGREGRVRLRMLQRALGREFSSADCQRALAALAEHRLLRWRVGASEASQRRRVKAGAADLEIVFQLNPSPP
jgi:hypothetical protein